MAGSELEINEILTVGREEQDGGSQRVVDGGACPARTYGAKHQPVLSLAVDPFCHKHYKDKSQCQPWHIDSFHSPVAFEKLCKISEGVADGVGAEENAADGAEQECVAHHGYFANRGQHPPLGYRVEMAPVAS